MAFHEVRLPDLWAVGSRGGPGFSTGIVEGDSGGSERVSRWPNARRRWSIKPGNKNQDSLAQLLDFYIARNGPAIGFRYKDWLDYTTAANHRAAPAATDVYLGPAQGTSGTFQLRTQYVSGSTTVYRAIEKPVAGTTLVAANNTPISGANYSVNTSTGVLTITTGITNGQSITAGCEFDVPVQFDSSVDDAFQAAIENYEWGDIDEIPLTEMVGDVVSPDRFYYGGSQVITSTLASIDYSARVLIYGGSGTATWLFPDPADLELGGPYFMIYNFGTSTPIITLRTFDNVSQIGSNITSGRFGLMVVYNDGTNNKWAALTS